MPKENPTFALAKNSRVENNAKLSAKSKQRLLKTKAANTLKAYAADWDDFTQWCQYNGAKPLPAEPEQIVNYINDLADYAKANTVSRRLSAISENHAAAGYAEDNPARSDLVRRAMEAIRREKGTLQRGKTPLLTEDITTFAAQLDGEGIAELRDKALLLLGFAGAFRRSELVALDVEDLSFTTEGLILLVRHAKSDQEGEGSYVAIPFLADASACPVRALRRWLTAADITSGPVFRPLARNKTVRSQRLSDKSVAIIVKRHAARCGLDAKEFAGHSLRRGFATSAARSGVDERSIMQQTRHKSEKMVRRYIEQGNLFQYNPLRKMMQTES